MVALDKKGRMVILRCVGVGRELSASAESNMRSNYQAGQFGEAEVSKPRECSYPERAASVAGQLPKRLIQGRRFSRNLCRRTMATMENELATIKNGDNS
jgi:hypothetical protein